MGKISDIIGRIKKVKHIEIIAIAAVAAVVLAVYFCCVSCQNNDSPQAYAIPDDADYCTSIQLQLENAISKISGVGDAYVVINWDKSVATSFSGGVENPKATGAIVVCDGGNSTKVKLDVIYAVSTLLDLHPEKIIVYPKS
ncbi:MAG: hypothetical protein J1G04_00585 [Clostridiales bacterium]|nr:hypothetical protein [Clostridiales bacterium]